MKRIVLAAALMLAGCSTPATEPYEPPPTRLSAPPPQRPPVNTDPCGARSLQYLVGHPRTDIPVPLHPSLRQVVCTTCPRAETYSPMRQTIMFDADTGIVREIRCG
jgi:hypothetical protein